MGKITLDDIFEEQHYIISDCYICPNGSWFSKQHLDYPCETGYTKYGQRKEVHNKIDKLIEKSNDFEEINNIIDLHNEVDSLPAYIKCFRCGLYIKPDIYWSHEDKGFYPM